MSDVPQRDPGSESRRPRPKRGQSRAVLIAGLVTLLAATLTPAATATAATEAPTCAARSEGGPVFVTAACVDPGLTQPYTDTNEKRTTTDPATNVKVSYRYIHGGFTGTKARFALYFPTNANYTGRFFESTYPTVSKEDAEPDVIAFAISHGAYVVSTNNNGGLPLGGALAGYRTNAASAKYSRVVAAKVYGSSARPRGYIYGASGGAYQTVAAAENTEGVWDGAVPMVPGTPNSIPSNMTVQLLGSRVLKDALPGIVDAMEPGGSGDPYAGLDAQQRSALEEATKLGFPLRGWWQYASLTGGAFAAVEGGVQALDAGYVDDFWSMPGYEGSDPAVAAARVRHDTTAQSVTRDAIELADAPPSADFIGAELSVTSGAAAGKKLLVANISGNRAILPSGADTAVTSAIQPGDQVRLDNSWNIALQYYQRHQVPTPDQYGWNQYRSSDSAPIYPQRSTLVGETFVKSIGGSIADGKFHGKMIMLASLMDVQAFPWPADWYKKQAEASLGAQSLDATFRLWFMDNADHDPGGPTATTAANAAAHIVGYSGELQQAVLDLDKWVKDGVAPPASTNYTVDANTQLQVTGTAAQREGVQPTVTLSVGKTGGDHTEVAAGRPVKFSAKTQTPPGAGKIVRVEWDFTGTGKFPDNANIGKPRTSVNATTKHTYSKPGTYFAVVRVTAQRDGDTKTPYQRIQNLARVQVLVH